MAWPLIGQEKYNFNLLEVDMAEEGEEAEKVRERH
jgi:hypothetical protein